MKRRNLTAAWKRALPQMFKAGHPWRRPGLAVVLTVAFGALIAGLAGVLTVAVSHVVGKQARAHMGNDVAELAFQMKDRLDRGIFEQLRDVRFAASLETMRDPNASLAEKRAVLERLHAAHPEWASAFLVSPEGRVLVASGGLAEGIDVSRHDSFRGGRLGPYVGDVHDAPVSAELLGSTKLLGRNSAEPPRFIDLIAPVTGSDGQLAGLVGSHLNWQWAKQIETSLSFPISGPVRGEVLIASRDGTVIFGPHSLMGEKLDTASFRAARTDSGGYRLEAWPDGESYLTGFATSAGFRDYAGLGWTVLVRERSETALAPVYALRQRIMLFGLAAALGSVVLALGLARRLSHPLRSLTEAAEAAHRSETARFPVIGGYQEAYQLSRSVASLLTERSHRDASFRLLFDHNPIPMGVFDLASLKYLAVNAAAVEHYGYSREQFVSMTALDLHQREEHALVRAFVDTIGRRNQAEQTWRHIRADGSQIDVTSYSRRLMYRGVEAALVAWVDITERKRAEDDLRATRIFLDAVVENIPAMLFVKDAHEHRFVHLNRAGEKLMGFSREEVIGKTAYELMPRDRADYVAAQDREVLASGRLQVTQDLAWTRSRGERLLQTKKVPIHDEDGRPQYLLGVSEDITDRTALESQLAQAQKMEAIGQLTGGLAHDFNNLLGIVIGNLDLVQDAITDPEHRELLGEALEAAMRGADLNRRLLAFARRQPLQPKLIDVNEVVTATSKLLARTLGEQIELRLSLASNLGAVLADPAQLEAAITNLGVNARDAMPRGGQLTIATRDKRLDADYASEHPDVLPGDYVAIELTDTGTGIDPDALKRVFEPFFTTKGVGKGTGLGLSMVFGFIKQSGGHVKIYSELGIGTTVRLYLPHSVETGAVAEMEQRLEVAVPRAVGREVVLAVEDSEPLRRVLVKQLRDLGYVVLEAEAGRAALDLLRSDTQIDLLLTDVVMPGGMNGVELAREAVTARPALKVLFTSGFPEAAIGSQTQLPVDKILLAKPYRRDELAEKLRQVLAA